MLRNLIEEALYWLISVFINLILFTLLTTVFIVKVKETPEIYPLRVTIKEIEFKEEKPKERPKSVVKTKTEAQKTATVKKEVKKVEEKKVAGATVQKAHVKGDVPVPVEEEEDVSILAELKKRIESRLEKEKKVKKEKKEVGTLSAVVEEGRIKIKGGTRKIVSTPRISEIITEEFPGNVRVRIWVDPSGRVIKAILVQRSGNAKIDNIVLAFVRGIRFEKIEEEEIQVGEIVFTFKGG